MSQIARDLKPVFERLSEPLLALLFRLGATPNLVTFTGLFLVALGSLALYMEQKVLSFLLLLLGGLCDALDGALARRLGRRSDFGAFFDSLVDRISDSLPFIAIALSSQSRLLSLASILAMLFSFTVSYARARAEGLGYELQVGLLERPERWTILLVGIVFDIIPLAIGLILVGSVFTTLQRAYIFKKLSGR